MLKAILYYILFSAEYLITIFLGGFLVGLYMAMNMDSGSHSQQIGALKESVSSVYNSHRISGHTHRMVHLRTLQILQVLAWKGDSCSQMEGDDHLHHADSRLHHGLLFHHESLPSRLPSQADDGY